MMTMEELCTKERYEEKVEIALKLIEIGKLSYEEIVECSGLSLETVKELAQKKTA